MPKSSSSLITLFLALAAGLGGTLVYTQSEARLAAAQAVDRHAARPAHEEALEADKDFEVRIHRLEAESLLLSEILIRIESKLDKLVD